MVFQRFRERSQDIGLLLCMLLTFLVSILLMLYPFTPMQTSTWPIAALISLLLVGTFFGCGSIFRGRPQFQFHYHGTHTVVMDEIANEKEEPE
ncbi:MAG: hypothetical protein ACXADF_07405 [Candidatus Thorarchaeota archaeon]